MVCFSLGSNLGDRLGYLKKAMVLLKKVFGEPLLISSIYETEGWGVNNHPSYLNAVVCYKTLMPPHEVLSQILNIEKKYGRERRKGQIEPRTIDIDILMYNDVVLKNENLTIPHPQLKYRKFVLLPLSEIMGDFIHPEYGMSIKELLDTCADVSGISKTALSLESL
jgi:2-amino-4-hydroxy-6-hydroxymethyldihydropteridine diphosphokinase